MQIEQLITSIQMRPKMFIKEEKIEYIYYLLSGYCGSNKKISEDDMEQKFCCWFGKWLIMWIENNIDAEYTPKTGYWYDDIKIIAKDENKELDVFFDLCKIFFMDYANREGYFSLKD